MVGFGFRARRAENGGGVVVRGNDWSSSLLIGAFSSTEDMLSWLSYHLDDCDGGDPGETEVVD